MNEPVLGGDKQLALRSPRRSQVGRRENCRQFWRAIALGRSSEDAAVDAGVSPVVGVRWFRKAGGAPDLMPLWTILDVTPEGRGTDWYPKLNY